VRLLAAAADLIVHEVHVTKTHIELPWWVLVLGLAACIAVAAVVSLLALHRARRRRQPPPLPLNRTA
jgi:hypothetical protein